MSKEVFISHSHEDSRVAIALADCFVAGAGLSYRDILCTSHPRQEARLRRGEDINLRLRKYLGDCRVLVPVLSLRSVERNYVLFEIGGAWALGVHIMPVVVERRVRRLMPEVLRGLLYTRHDSRSELRELVSDLAERCFVASDRPSATAVDDAVRQYLRALRAA